MARTQSSSTGETTSRSILKVLQHWHSSVDYLQKQAVILLFLPIMLYCAWMYGKGIVEQ